MVECRGDVIFLNKSVWGIGMKVRIALLVMIIMVGIGFSSCGSSSPSIQRVDAEALIDLSGYWNDSDVRIVCETLINDCLDSPRIAQVAAAKGDLPVVIVGSFRNQSDEHIDTSIISRRMEMAILNSGVLDFVASSSERGELREERAEQQSWASDETAKDYANETGADFMLTGSVRTMVDQAGNQSVRTYFVYAELTEIESNRRIWIGENDEIKKVITRPKVKG
jgi:uncharacterized protein (TIGR02722 family)